MRPDPSFWTQPRRIPAVGDAWRVLLFQRPSLKCLHPGLETWTEMDTAARNTRLSGRCLLCKLLERLPGERDIRTLCEYLKDAQETPLLGEIWDGSYVPQGSPSWGSEEGVQTSRLDSSLVPPVEPWSEVRWRRTVRRGLVPDDGGRGVCPDL